MSKASKELSRRGAIRLGAVMFPAMVTAGPAVALASTASDPMFAAIEAHKRAWAIFSEICCSEPEDGPSTTHDAWEQKNHEAMKAANAAAWALLEVRPTTVAGVAAFLGYVSDFSAEYEWPDREVFDDEHRIYRGIRFEDDAIIFAADALAKLAA